MRHGLCKYKRLRACLQYPCKMERLNYFIKCRYKVTIEKEAFLTVRLCLVVVPGTRKEDITRVISDPSSLDQCDQYLQNFPSLRKEAAADAAQAAQAVAGSNERWLPPKRLPLIVSPHNDLGVSLGFLSRRFTGLKLGCSAIRMKDVACMSFVSK